MDRQFEGWLYFVPFLLCGDWFLIAREASQKRDNSLFV